MDSFAQLFIIVKNIDMFGKPVRFTFKRHEKSKSTVGAVFSVLIFGFCVFLLYLFSKDFFNRSNPNTIVSQSFQQDPSSMTLGPNDFAFGFGLQQPITFEHYKDETIYTVKAYQYTFQKVSNGDGTYETQISSIELELETCTEDHFGSVGSNFANLELNQLYCLKTNQPNLDSITIQGTFESDTYKYFQANFYVCNNSTSSVTCADNDTITSTLAGGYFATYFTSLAIDPNSYSSPNVKYRNSFFTTAPYPYFKEIDQYLVHTNVISDVGIITSSTVNNTYLDYGSTQEMTSYITDADAMINFLVRPGQMVTNYSRTYKKIQDVFAQVNGIASVALVVAAIILSPYVYIKFNESLINDLFNVKTIEDPAKLEEVEKKDKDDKNKKKKPVKIMARKNLRKVSVASSEPFKVGAKSPKNIPTSQLIATGMPYNPNSNEIMSNNSFQIEQSSGARLTNNTPLIGYNTFNDNTPTRPKQKKETPPPLPKSENFEDLINSINKIDDLIKQPKEQVTRAPRKTKQEGLQVTVSPKIDKKANIQEIDTEKNDFVDQMILEELENEAIGTPGAYRAGYKSSVETAGTKRGNNPGISQEVRVEIKNQDMKSEEAQEAEEENQDKAEEIDDDTDKPKETPFMFAINVADTLKKENPKQLKHSVTHEKLTRLSVKLMKPEEKLNITFWEYIQYFFYRTKKVKHKMYLLKQGIEKINQRLDIFNVFRKFREIDKLKHLLMEGEQSVLFEHLPKPELVVNYSEIDKKKEKKSTEKKRSKSYYEEVAFAQDQKNHELALASYHKIRAKTNKTIVDERLLGIYEDIMHAE